MDIKISPSILSADFARLSADVDKVSAAEMLHIDVMDGHFVPNITIGVPVVKSIRKCTDMFLDVHLMIDKPVRYVESFARAGADLLSIHLEADHPTRIAEALKVMDQCGVKKAVALRPITSARAILPYIEQLRPLYPHGTEVRTRRDWRLFRWMMQTFGPRFTLWAASLQRK